MKKKKGPGSRDVSASLAPFSADRIVGGVMRLTHTEVPPAIEGRGIAAALVRAALAHAEANGLKVEPWCSYVRTYLRRHPETRALLPDGFRL